MVISGNDFNNLKPIDFLYHLLEHNSLFEQLLILLLQTIKRRLYGKGGFDWLFVLVVLSVWYLSFLLQFLNQVLVLKLEGTMSFTENSPSFDFLLELLYSWICDVVIQFSNQQFKSTYHSLLILVRILNLICLCVDCSGLFCSLFWRWSLWNFSFILIALMGE